MTGRETEFPTMDVEHMIIVLEKIKMDGFQITPRKNPGSRTRTLSPYIT